LETICVSAVSVYTFAASMENVNPANSDLLQGAIDLFQRLGVKNVTMDEIARNLGISKKTIYKQVCNKAALVDQCCLFTLDSISSRIEEFSLQSKNAIEELYSIDSFMRSKIKKQMHMVEFQISKYYPKAYQKLSEKRKILILHFQESNLHRGINEGLYRKEIQVDMVAQLYYSKTLSLMQFFHELESPEKMELLMDEALKYHIRGIASKKGIEYLENRILDPQTNESLLPT
jgi:AcrR family transcriptional regulator